MYSYKYINNELNNFNLPQTGRIIHIRDTLRHLEKPSKNSVNSVLGNGLL